MSEENPVLNNEGTGSDTGTTPTPATAATPPTPATAATPATPVEKKYKALVKMASGQRYLVNKDKNEVDKLVDGEIDFISLPITKQTYNTELTTINIGEKIEPAYSYTETTVSVNKTYILAIEESEEELVVEESEGEPEEGEHVVIPLDGGKTPRD